jgi:hypothetical protein
MPVSAETLRKLMAAGLSGDALLDVVASIDADGASVPKVRTAHAMRQERYRQRLASQTVTSDASRDGMAEKENPQTPKENQEPQKENTPLRGVQKKKGQRLPSDFALPDEWRDWALSRGLPAERVPVEFEKLCNWAANAPNRVGLKADWFKAWKELGHQSDRRAAAKPGRAKIQSGTNRR